MDSYHFKVEFVCFCKEALTKYFGKMTLSEKSFPLCIISMETNFECRYLYEWEKLLGIPWGLSNMKVKPYANFKCMYQKSIHFEVQMILSPFHAYQPPSLICCEPKKWKIWFDLFWSLLWIPKLPLIFNIFK